MRTGSRVWMGEMPLCISIGWRWRRGEEREEREEDGGGSNPPSVYLKHDDRNKMLLVALRVCVCVC